jgi:hypothetical protein
VVVKVHPHRLRHTSATQFLNAGCRITSIQKFLGHKELNITSIYARVHDQTVADDYYAAMSQVEKRLELVSNPPELQGKLTPNERERLLELADQLSEPDLSMEAHIGIVTRMRQVLMSQQANSIPVPATSVECIAC